MLDISFDANLLRRITRHRFADSDFAEFKYEKEIERRREVDRNIDAMTHEQTECRAQLESVVASFALMQAERQRRADEAKAKWLELCAEMRAAEIAHVQERTPLGLRCAEIQAYITTVAGMRRGEREQNVVPNEVCEYVNLDSSFDKSLKTGSIVLGI